MLTSLRIQFKLLSTTDTVVNLMGYVPSTETTPFNPTSIKLGVAGTFVSRALKQNPSSPGFMTTGMENLGLIATVTKNKDNIAFGVQYKKSGKPTLNELLAAAGFAGKATPSKPADVSLSVVVEVETDTGVVGLVNEIVKTRYTCGPVSGEAKYFQHG